MKKALLLSILILATFSTNAQTCKELIEYVKSESYGTTYTSYNSDAISKVVFHTVTIEYQTYYFAIVSFKNKNSYNTSDYIYKVSSNTKFNYSMNYLDSAGKAFWNYIQPHRSNLGFGPTFN